MGGRFLSLEGCVLVLGKFFNIFFVKFEKKWGKGIFYFIFFVDILVLIWFLVLFREIFYFVVLFYFIVVVCLLVGFSIKGKGGFIFIERLLILSEINLFIVFL